MSKNPENKPIPQPANDGQDAPRLERRLFIFNATAMLTAAATLTLTSARRAEAQRTDRDPTDRAGRGKGVTDRDPTDRAGQGSDRDPTDRVGRGKGSGTTDRDPTDRAGRGKGSDRDPTDP